MAKTKADAAISGLPIALSPRLQRAACIAELRALGENPPATKLMAVRERYAPYVWWQVQQLLAGDEEAVPTYLTSKEALRHRVTARLLAIGENEHLEPKDRIQALGKILASTDAPRARHDDVSEQTEDAVRSELRDPSPRLIELMIEEWCDTSTADDEGNVTRPAIGELVRRLLTHWEDVLEAEGWVRR